MLVSNSVPLVHQIKSYNLNESVICHPSGVVFSLLDLEDYSISQCRPQHASPMWETWSCPLFFNANVRYDSLCWCNL